MVNYLPVIIFLVSAIFLIRSSTVVVNRLSRISKFLQVSEFVASFILIATATSLPDIFVGISAAAHGQPLLSFSNIIGANIITLTLAAGLAAVFAKGLVVRREIVRKNILVAVFAAILPVLLLFDGSISRVDGIILVALSVWYLWRLIFVSERFTKIFKNNNRKNHLFSLRQFFRDLAILLIGLVVLVASAEALTRSAVSLASDFGIGIHYIGILLVAASITLPEVVFGTRAIMLGHKEMVIGNIIGSIVINSGLAIGPTALISPIVFASFTPFIAAIAFTILAAFAFLIFSRSDKRLSAKEGFALISIYAAFLITLLIYSGGEFVV